MRVLARVGGSILIVAGVLTLAAAVVVTAWIGRDNTIRMEPRRISSDGAAITSGEGLLSVYDATLDVRVTSPDPTAKLWIGVAYADDLDSYLGDTSRTTITSYRYPGSIHTDSYRGETRSLARPAALDWWIASDAGHGRAGLTWAMQNAPCGVVIMKQSGKPGLDIELDVGLQVDGVFETALLVGAGGLLAVLLGIGAFLLTRRHHPAAAGAMATTGESTAGRPERPEVAPIESATEAER